ncbi:hypothetical protein NLI96_g5005 [Meripilus lineatus]|uniref:Prenyltransferase alpha-alpha toroid domain-containing protein n=1 Tax=Meripilus lineatus TaxID=2056292 RepID=A0AAD5V5R1_9APHY|nr:hypothetical protein NLI96_g5005 [Physisporinus lineatus]
MSSAQLELGDLPQLSKTGHAAHCNRCLSGLPSSQLEADASRLAVGFYCLGTLDILGLVSTKIRPDEAEGWREWLWSQQQSGKYGTGFRPSSYMTPSFVSDWGSEDFSDHDVPHLIMTYTAILSLAILRDDLKQLDRPGVIQFLKSCQREDGRSECT